MDKRTGLTVLVMPGKRGKRMMGSCVCFICFESFSQKHSLQREGHLTDLIIKTKKVPLNFFCVSLEWMQVSRDKLCC